jgi:hypothetical protein
MIPQTDDYTPAIDTDQLAAMSEAELDTLQAEHAGKYPFSENSNLLDRETALDIRVALLQYMSEDELNACSVRELLHLYAEYLRFVLEDLLGEPDPEIKRWAAERAELTFGASH